MTTTTDDHAARAALARLQDTPRAPKQTIFKWLDVHQADVITLCMARGLKMTAEFLGMSYDTILNWRTSRNLTFDPPHLSRDGTKRLSAQNLRPQDLPMPSSNGAHPPAEQPPPVRGEPVEPQTDTDRVWPTLRRPTYARWIIMEDGRVLDVSSGKPIHLEAT